MYLDYSTYAINGGTVSEADYPRAARRAEYMLDDWTMGRIRAMSDAGETLPDYVADVMTEIVDALAKLGGERVTSFSNGVTSFSFDTSKSDIYMLYDDVVRILPVELVSRCICG